MSLIACTTITPLAYTEPSSGLDCRTCAPFFHLSSQMDDPAILPVRTTKSSNNNTTMSALRRVRSFPGRNLRRMGSGVSSVDSEASASSSASASSASSIARRLRSHVSEKMLRIRGRFSRRGRPGEAEAEAEGVVVVDVCAAAAAPPPPPLNRLQRHVSFAEQPELAELHQMRSSRLQARAPTPGPAPALVVDDDDDDGEEETESENESGGRMLTDANVSLLRTRRDADDCLYARDQWWRAEQDYYALAFPWC